MVHARGFSVYSYLLQRRRRYWLLHAPVCKARPSALCFVAGSEACMIPAIADLGACTTPHEAPIPIVVRVAGLPAEIMDLFSSKSLLDKVEEYELFQKSLECKKQDLQILLHAAIPNAPKDKRGFLLAVKRDCFGMRPLARYLKNPNWLMLTEIAGNLASNILDLEHRIEVVAKQLNEIYYSELHREWGSLVHLLEHRDFIRGVTLASPELAQNLHRLRGKELSTFGRKEKKLALTLLRYASRAALKLSPFSSLTRTGVGVIASEGAPSFELLSAGRWRERRVARLHRELLAQCICLLLSCPRFTEHLQVGLNDGLKSLGSDRYSFFRPSRWEFDRENKIFVYSEELFVKVKIEGFLVSRLIAELNDGAEAYNRLIQRLNLDSESFDTIEQGLAELLDIGFLTFIFPWDSNAPDLELRIQDYLQKLPHDTCVAAFAETVRTLLETIHRYSDTEAPLRHFEECKRTVEHLFRSILPLSTYGLDIEFRTTHSIFTEDVFLFHSSQGEEINEIARLKRDCAENIISNIDPLARLSNLSNSRYDLLHTLATLGHKYWPNKADVDFLEFFAKSKTVFKEYLTYKTQLFRYSALLAPGFNPLDLDPIKDLVQSRSSVTQYFDECLQKDDQAYRLCPYKLSALMDKVPGPYASSRDFCAFVQPLDRAGQMWVINALFDGYGRLSSRYTSSMDDNTREYWTTYFTSFSFIDLQGERVELVDISGPDRRGLNVHAAQTQRVLRLPGESSLLSPERLLRLKDLRIRLRGPDNFPVLTDSNGQRLLPIHLGGLSYLFTSMITKFLLAFGPGSIPRFVLAKN